MSWFILYVAIGWIIRAAMVPTILRRELVPGAAVAWLGIIFLHPYIGYGIYMLVGEARIEPSRVRRHRELIRKYRFQDKTFDALQLNLSPAYKPMALQAEKISGLPILGGNDVEFLCESAQLIDRLIADISAATSHVHLLYYMFAPDETGERVVQALIDTQKRGVKCRVLVDAVASRIFFHRHGIGRRLKDAGVAIAAALPVAPIQRRLPRMDLRNHRKLSIIDDRIAYMGSHNLVNPDYGGRRGAPWVDLTGRFTGPIIAELATVFAEDWAFESGEQIEAPLPSPESNLSDGSQMQAVPTGPTGPGESFRRVFLGAIQCAQSRVILTTPYFVPDEPTLIGLMMAADRGVNVSLIVPERSDHFLTAAAGRAHFSRLLEAGVSIHLYHPGLIHAKTVTIDDAFAIFGSANLDVRSFNLNFELSALLYGRDAAARLRALQEKYLADSRPIDPAQWANRPAIQKYTEQAVSLLSPLL